MALLPEQKRKVLTAISRPDAEEQSRRDAHVVYRTSVPGKAGDTLYFTKFYLPDFSADKAKDLQDSLTTAGTGDNPTPAVDPEAKVRFDANGVQELSTVGLLRSAWTDDFDINYNDLKASEYHTLYANVELVSKNKDAWKSVPLS